MQVALLLSKRNQFSYAALTVASARHAARHAARRRLLCLAQARRRLLRLVQARHRLLRLAQARRRLLRLRRASRCLCTLRGSSRGSSRRSSTTPRRTGSSSTTPPCTGSSSSTSPPPRVRVPRHVARLITRIVARLVVDYFTYATRLGALARRAAHRLSSTTSPTPRDSSRGSLRCSSSTTPPHAGLSSTTSPPPRVRVPRHVARLVSRIVTRLVVDYFAYAARPGALARRAARHVASRAARRRLLRVAQSHCRLLHAPRLRLAATLALLQPRRGCDYLPCGNTGSTSSTPHAATTLSYGRIALTIHLD
jgi:hypothetical protein